MDRERVEEIVDKEIDNIYMPLNMYDDWRIITTIKASLAAAYLQGWYDAKLRDDDND